MHKGRPYPYLFQFWATNWLFWPAFVPRRMLLTNVFHSGSDWDVLPTASDPPILFDVGSTFDGDLTAYWEYTEPSGDWVVTLRFLSDLSAPGAQGKCKFGLFYPSGKFAIAETGMGFDSVPEFFGIFDSIFDASADFDLGPIPGPPSVTFRPATYTEGGDS